MPHHTLVTSNTTFSVCNMQR